MIKSAVFLLIALSRRSHCDGHIAYSTTRTAFDTNLWGGTGANPSAQTPGDNPTKWRTIVSYLRP